MRVLVVGANGFLGARIVRALRDAGHEVFTAARSGADVRCDLARDLDPATWLPRLRGLDAVVNCAGILRERGPDTFQRVHVDAPLALYRACAAAGVRRAIQVSALGAAEDGEFIASKHRGDAALAQLDLDWVVLRPGLVYSAHGAYGGTTMLRAMAALPGVVLLPHAGRQELQPLAAEDLACAIVAVLARPHVRAQTFEVVGPQVLARRDYLAAWRRWFGLRPAREIRTPVWMVRAAVICGEAWRRGPLCRAIANLLQRRRVGSAQALPRLREALGVEPQTLEQALARRASQPADLLEARWYVFRPLLLASLAIVWLGSAAAGFTLSPAAAQTALPIPVEIAQPLQRLASGADLVLGALLAVGWRVRRVLQTMLLMALGYTATIGMLAPAHWLDPFGGLLKNIPIVVLIVALLALEPRR